ncbi:hypothetical protein BWK47_05215 [Synechocystis sp. CACIAM 05]|nr:hypothetical protein BWK47_05215 [Synechocystis sp. CACIAM 05]
MPWLSILSVKSKLDAVFVPNDRKIRLFWLTKLATLPVQGANMPGPSLDKDPKRKKCDQKNAHG